MFNPEKKIGASLLVMGLMLNVNEAFAQTTRSFCTDDADLRQGADLRRTRL